MIKYLSIIVFTLFAFLGTLTSAESDPAYVSPELRQCMARIQKIPEARELIKTIQKEGPIRVFAKNTSLSDQFGAFWDRDQRVICIALSARTGEDEVIGSILFELHNASVDKKFDELDELAARGKITKSKYVQSMEYIEYVNSLATAKMAEKGIQMGVIPPGSRLFTYKSFEEHFSAQVSSGHSACFAHCYDGIVQERARS